MGKKTSNNTNQTTLVAIKIALDHYRVPYRASHNRQLHISFTPSGDSIWQITRPAHAQADT